MLEGIRHKEWPLSSLNDIEEVNLLLKAALREMPNTYDLLFLYNEFRVIHAAKLSDPRPQVLVGGPFDLLYPNVHTYPLMEVADVICVGCSSHPILSPTFISCSPSSHFKEVLGILPPGFVPQFYWDNQVEHKHYIPAGIDQAPFPVIASVCHTYFAKSVEHVCKLFDAVLPMSKYDYTQLSQRYGSKILNVDMPFGLNWGAFYHINPCWNKTIDLCITFPETDSPIFENKRNRVIEMAREFKKKYGDRFVIEFVSNLPRQDYYECLKKSRITLNVVGIHGPYNYRTVEAMCAGSMVFQYNWEGVSPQHNFSELFVDGEHGVEFSSDNFEEKLLYYLNRPAEITRIAKTAYNYIKDKCSYTKMYQSLIEVAKHIKIDRKKKDLNYHLDMIYYYQQNNTVDCMVYGILDELDFTDWKKINNVLVLYPVLHNDSSSKKIVTAYLSEQFSHGQNVDTWVACAQLYSRAMSIVPKEFSWIIEWNYLLLKIEHSKFDRKNLEELLTILENTDPVPFDETEITFKCYLEVPSYPKYYHNKKDPFNPGLELNIALLKNCNNPQERARIHLHYALEAVKYFLVFSK